MIFKKINLEYYSFTEEDGKDISTLLCKGLKKARGNLLSVPMEGDASEEVTSDEGGSLLDPDGFL